MMRDRDALQKHCNNLTRRQIQFQHEIRRKELQYEWLQEKLRNYLAERKRESSASMEIVGLLRQQVPAQHKDSSRIVAGIDDIMVNTLLHQLSPHDTLCSKFSARKEEQHEESCKPRAEAGRDDGEDDRHSVRRKAKRAHGRE